ncbi:hypothetical protein E2C01_057825 [Portunus trituberculatus]|uniref:Uncharacterized protein n=1 Tax=Portunus trituberculatus TaxID=210409 RepID=A0A5B7H120_PORTR|nr:hypothetical protein [Portunus trituberculatus]
MLTFAPLKTVPCKNTISPASQPGQTHARRSTRPLTAKRALLPFLTTSLLLLALTKGGEGASVSTSTELPPQTPCQVR